MADEPRSVIRNEEWDMPVSFDDKGALVSLRDYVAGRGFVYSFLSADQRLELAVKRIELSPKYEMGAIGEGTINKDRAINEIRGKTTLGRRLAEIEMRVVTHLISEIAKRGN